MGTNYYVTLNETDNDKLFDNAEYKLIYNNKTILFATIHIGKSSYGWAFHYRGYRNVGLDSNKSFKEFIDEPNRIIIDEYGEIVDKDEFHTMIETVKSPTYVINGQINKDHMNYCIQESSLSMETIQREMWHDELGYSFWENNFS